MTNVLSKTTMTLNQPTKHYGVLIHTNGSLDTESGYENAGARNRI